MRPGERGHRPPRRSVRERVDSCALSVRSAKVRNLRTSRAAPLWWPRVAANLRALSRERATWTSDRHVFWRESAK
jgi:hypothetical protein